MNTRTDAALAQAKAHRDWTVAIKAAREHARTGVIEIGGCSPVRRAWLAEQDFLEHAVEMAETSFHAAVAAFDAACKEAKKT